MWVKSRAVVVAVVLFVGVLFSGSLPAGAEAIVLRLQPGLTVAGVGDEVTIGVLIAGASNLGAFEFHLGFDPSVLQPVDAALGPFLTSTGRSPVPLGPAIKRDEIRFAGASYGTSVGPEGTGRLAEVSFRVVGSGASLLTFNRVIVTNTDAQVLPSGGLDGLITTEQSLRFSVYLPFLYR